MARRVLAYIVYGWNGLMVALFAYLLGGGTVVASEIGGYGLSIGVAAFLLTLTISAAGNVVLGVLWLVSGK